MTHSIITGASRGIGKALAMECAYRRRNLVLISLPDEQLRDYGDFLAGKYKVRVLIYETDLTCPGAANRFFEWCLDKKLNIDMLINNAGLGSQGRFEAASPCEIKSLMKLNMESMVSMCWNAIPFLKKNKRSYILNVGSISSFTAVPYKAVYAASKSFVLSFSNSLNYELSGSGIFVSCLCPGPTLTSQKQVDKVREQGLKARILISRTQEVAREAIKGMLKQKRVIVPGWGNKLFRVLAKFIPVKVKLMLGGMAFSNSSFNHHKA